MNEKQRKILNERLEEEKKLIKTVVDYIVNNITEMELSDLNDFILSNDKFIEIANISFIKDTDGITIRYDDDILNTGSNGYITSVYGCGEIIKMINNEYIKNNKKEIIVSEDIIGKIDLEGCRNVFNKIKKTSNKNFSNNSLENRKGLFMDNIERLLNEYIDIDAKILKDIIKYNIFNAYNNGYDEELINMINHMSDLIYNDDMVITIDNKDTKITINQKDMFCKKDKNYIVMKISKENRFMKIEYDNVYNIDEYSEFIDELKDQYILYLYNNGKENEIIKSGSKNYKEKIFGK